MRKLLFLTLMTLLLLLVSCSKETEPKSETALLPAQQPSEFYCDEIEDVKSRDECYFGYADISFMGISSCDDSGCVDVPPVDSSFCDKIVSEEIKESCYSNADLWEKAKADKCDDVDGQDIRDRCYFRSAVLFSHNKETCYKIQGSYLKESCLGNLIEFGVLTEEDCDNLGVTKDMCYESVAIDTGNAALCNKISLKIVREVCLKKIQENK